MIRCSNHKAGDGDGAGSAPRAYENPEPFNAECAVLAWCQSAPSGEVRSEDESSFGSEGMSGIARKLSI
jgi:hypothetical protein